MKAAEKQLAAYLGFDIIPQLQRFSIMWPCLDAWRRLSSISRPVLSTLQLPSFLRSHSCQSYTELIGDHLIEALLRQKIVDIGTYTNSTAEYNQTRTALTILRMPSTLWLPDFVTEENVIPLFSILEPNRSCVESSMVPMHRCLALFQYLDATHGSEGWRVGYLESHKGIPAEELIVSESDVPWFICPGH